MNPPIILITDSLSRRRGGAEIYLANLAAFLAQNDRRSVLRRIRVAIPAEGVPVRAPAISVAISVTFSESIAESVSECITMDVSIAESI